MTDTAHQTRVERFARHVQDNVEQALSDPSAQGALDRLHQESQVLQRDPSFREAVKKDLAKMETANDSLHPVAITESGQIGASELLPGYTGVFLPNNSEKSGIYRNWREVKSDPDAATTVTDEPNQSFAANSDKAKK